jgi:hypothetical protein
MNGNGGLHCGSIRRTHPHLLNSVAQSDCSRESAIDVVYGAAVNSIFECALLRPRDDCWYRPSVGKDEYLNIVCTDRDPVPSNASRISLWAGSVKSASNVHGRRGCVSTTTATC